MSVVIVGKWCFLYIPLLSSMVVVLKLHPQLTSEAAPPGTTDLMNIPISPCFRLPERPITVTPRPAGPELLRGISRLRTVLPTVVGSLTGGAVECEGVVGNWGGH